MPNSELFDIAAELRHETDKAYYIFDGTRSVWVPKSQVEKYEEGNKVTFTMPLWLAKEKGLV